MLKCRIHIGTDVVFMDDDVFIDIELPCLPQVGNSIWLTNDQDAELAAMASKESDIRERYVDRYEFNDEISFPDANIVTNIRFKPNQDYVDIELSPNDNNFT